MAGGKGKGHVTHRKEQARLERRQAKDERRMERRQQHRQSDGQQPAREERA